MSRAMFEIETSLHIQPDAVGGALNLECGLAITQQWHD